jgi:hypothetical protein
LAAAESSVCAHGDSEYRALCWARCKIPSREFSGKKNHGESTGKIMRTKKNK